MAEGRAWSGDLIVFVRPGVGHLSMVGHLFQNYDTIYVRFFPRILAFFAALWGFHSQVYDHFFTNAHIYAHTKSPYICVTNKRATGLLILF